MAGASLGSASATLELDVSRFVAGANKATDAMETMQRKSEASSKGIGNFITANEQHLTKVGTALSVFGVATTGIMTLATSTAMDFEAAMSAVASVSGATADQMERAEKVILDIGYQTTMSATEAAAALEILIKAGVELDDALDGIALAAVNLSEATGVDITVAAETAAAAMNIFGYEAEEANRVMDAISQSANASALDVNDWSLALKYAGPIVSMLGWDIEDLAEMMVILGDAGIRGETGATALRNVLLSLVNPTSELTAGFAKYGVTLTDANGSLKDLSQITAELAPAWERMTQAQKADFAELVAGKQGVSSFTALMEAQTQAVKENSNAFDRARERMIAAGTTQEMAQRRMDNLAGSVEELKGTIETLAITFTSGLTPVIRKAVDALSGILQLFLRLPGPVQTAIASVVGITGVLALFTGGGMLAAVKVMELADSFKSLTNSPTVVEGLAKAVSKLSTAMSGLFLNPAFLVAVAALGAAFLAYRNNFLGFADLVDGAIGKLQQFFNILTGTPSSKTVTFEIDSLTDEDWDGWEQLPDGSFKNAELGITATADDMTIFWVENQDGSTSYRITIKTEAGPQDGLILQSLRDPNSPNLIRMNIRLDNGEEIWGIYDEYSGKWAVIPSKIVPEVDDAKAREDMSWWEKIADNLNKGFAAFGMLWNLHINPALNNGSNIMDRFVQAADRFISAGMTGFQTLVVLIGAKLTTAIDAAQKAWDSLTQKVSGAWETLQSVSDSILGSIQSVVDTVVGAITSAVDAATQKINDLIDLANKIPGINIGKIGDDSEGEKSSGGSGEVTRTPRDPNLAYSGSGSILGDLKFGSGSDFGKALNETIAAMKAGESASGSFGQAISALGATAQQSNGIFGQTASTVNMYAGSTNTAKSATSTMAASMGSSFGSMSSSAQTAFATMQSDTTSKASSMQASVVASMLGMKTNSAVQMALMAATAGTTGTQMNTGLTGWMAGAQARVVAAMASMVASIRNASGSGYQAGYYTGSQIGLGFANGMYAYLGMIQGAAAAMVNAASAALRAKAMISSPSRLFMQYGEFMGEGLEIGMLRSLPDIKRAAALMVDTGVPLPGYGTAGYGVAGGSTQTIYIVNNTANVTASSEELALIAQDARTAPERTADLIAKSRSIAGGMV